MSLQKIEIQILVENVSGPGGTLGESGFSALVQAKYVDSYFRILFDTGPSPVALLNNIKKLKIDLTTIDSIVLSHGHWDHVGGLKEAITFTKKRIPIICHPLVLSPKFIIEKNKIIDVGIQGYVETPEDLNKKANLITTKSSYKLSESIITTGEVPRRNDYEILSGRLKDIKTVKNGKNIPDLIDDDLSLIFQLPDDSLVILTGCCHAGIVNTANYAVELTESNKITGIIGGLHLHDASNNRLTQTVKELKKYPIKVIAPSHCTGLRGKCTLLGAFEKKYHEVTVSTKLKFEAPQ